MKQFYHHNHVFIVALNKNCWKARSLTERGTITTTIDSDAISNPVESALQVADKLAWKLGNTYTCPLTHCVQGIRYIGRSRWIVTYTYSQKTFIPA